MNKFILSAIVSGLLWSGAATSAQLPPIPTLSTLPQVTQGSQHNIASERFVALLENSHYKNVKMTADFSTRIFDRYLSMLDFEHNLFLAHEINAFSEEASRTGLMLKKGELSWLFNVYNQAIKHRFERYQYALSLLDKPMNFDGNDSIEIDRSKAPWAKDKNELNLLWQKKVKFDRLNLKLSGKSDKESLTLLKKRYQTAQRRLAQAKNEDAFQLMMNALAREIDPHTSYLSPRNAEQFNTSMSLSLEGIGATMTVDEDYTKIHSLVPGGPAEKGKQLQAGDRIIAVGQGKKEMVDVVGWRLDDVVALIKGPRGTEVRLDVLPSAKGAKSKIITIKRDKIHLEDSAAKLEIETLNKQKVGVLTVPSFYMGLTKDVVNELKKLRKTPVASLILDLRMNGGGALPEAIDLTGLFIPKGPVVQVRDNRGRIRQDQDSDGLIRYDGPLVVMIDRYSASASEIFAAAMQDYGRALIVGEPSYGKGTVQQYRGLDLVYDSVLYPDMSPLGSVQYTIQKFYRINGGSTQLKGVTPDIMMPTGLIDVEFGERFEDNALEWDKIPAATYKVQGQIKPFIKSLNAKHEKRIKNDVEFDYIKQDIAQYLKQKDEKTISLNFAIRDKESKALEAMRLKRINDRLKREGKAGYKTLDDVPKDDKAPDAYLKETQHIALDFSADFT